MNKSELVSAIAGELGVNKKDVSKSLGCLFSVISKELSSGGDVRIVDFGVFRTISFSSRKVNNPRTGVEMDVPASRRARFTPGKALKEAVRKGK